MWKEYASQYERGQAILEMRAWMLWSNDYSLLLEAEKLEVPDLWQSVSELHHEKLSSWHVACGASAPRNGVVHTRTRSLRSTLWATCACGRARRRFGRACKHSATPQIAHQTQWKWSSSAPI